MQKVNLAPLADMRVPVFLSVPRDAFQGDFPVRVNVVRSGAAGESILVTGTFLGPSR